MLGDMLDWMAQSSIISLIRTDQIAYAAINATHILGLAILVGAIISSDLRTAGIWKTGFWKEGVETCAPIAAVGLAIAILTGALLFAVRSSYYLSNPAFLIKIALVLASLLNALLFRLLFRKFPGSSPSIAIKTSAVLSAGIWIAAIFSGRWIAFIE